MKYVNYNKDTLRIEGYYDDKEHSQIPSPNISITDEKWQKALSEGANFVNLKDNSLFYKAPKKDKTLEKRAKLSERISLTEESIKKALFLGDDNSLLKFRKEYKNLLTEFEALKEEKNETND